MLLIFPSFSRSPVRLCKPNKQLRIRRILQVCRMQIIVSANLQCTATRLQELKSLQSPKERTQENKLQLRTLLLCITSFFSFSTGTPKPFCHCNGYIDTLFCFHDGKCKQIRHIQTCVHTLGKRDVLDGEWGLWLRASYFHPCFIFGNRKNRLMKVACLV